VVATYAVVSWVLLQVGEVTFAPLHLPECVMSRLIVLVIAGFPSAFVHAFFSGSLLIETIFSLDGLGLLGFESVLNRDYPVVFATLYIFALLGLVVNLVSDFVYTLVDPRIDFESREV
jgi:microcin C transport system permease protein